MRRSIVVSAAVLAGILAGTASAGSRGARPVAPLLDVPYLPQPPQLCGGAAAAMVMRYWGDTHARADDFAPLLAPEGDGIATGDLVARLRALAWDATALRGSGTSMCRALDRGEPVIALVRNASGRLHYVVVVARSPDRVIYHDPSVAPLRSVPARTFDAMWSGGRYWLLVLLPGRSRGGAGVDVSTPSDSGACKSAVADAVALARGGACDSAAVMLEELARSYPGEAAPLRELSGVRFAQGRWRDAAMAAAGATERDRSDRHAWRLLGASLYMQDRPLEALDAWNHVGEPRVTRVRLSGVAPSRYAAVQRAVALDGAPAFSRRLARRARRRAAEFPGVTSTRVAYRVTDDGGADVTVALAERTPFSGNGLDLAVRGVRAVADREVSVDRVGSGPLGGAWGGSVRWWRNRPRVAMHVDGAGLLGPQWITTAAGAWERAAFARTEPGGRSFVEREEFRSVQVGGRSWIGADQCLDVALGYYNGGTSGRYAALDGGWELHSAGDGAVVRMTGTLWGSTRAVRTNGRVGTDVVFDAGRDRPAEWMTRLGFHAASPSSPKILWPGAGVGIARPHLLRAHPLLDDGVIAGDGFGNVLACAGSELVWWTRGFESLPLHLGFAAFVDAARVVDEEADTALLRVDVGVGLRVRAPASPLDVVLDIGRGTRDDAFAVTLTLRPTAIRSLRSLQR